MVILFTQWKFFLRNGSFTVPESKNSFCAMTKLQILTTFILRNESRSYAYDVSILCLSCITSYYVPTKVHIKKLLLILYVRMYSKTPQMAPSKLADPSDWRLVLGHPLPTKWRPFPAEWRIFSGTFLSNIEIFVKLAFCLQIEI